ncbi:MAG: AHH domain-containing protein [Chitinophagales bacterium]|nr:AHH domain-containing protein [Chitinophagales bacterium]
MNKYRFGFNGKEQDNEIAGQQDYGLRIYDNRLIRFKSIDPLTSKYPYLTPYQFASNSPIAGVDLDGGEFKYYALDNRVVPSVSVVNNKKITTYVNDGLIARSTEVIYDPIVINGTVTISLTVEGFPIIGSDIPFSFSMSDLGISATIVNIGDGVKRVLPSGADLKNLPPVDDEYWDGLETEDEYLSRIQNSAYTQGDKLLSSIPVTMGGNKSKIRNAFKSELAKSSKPIQIHHYATNKSKKFTAQLKKIADKFGLDLDGSWNKEALPHQGRHPNKYHEFVLNGMRKASAQAGKSAEKFKELFDKYVKEPIRKNPEKLTKDGWK